MSDNSTRGFTCNAASAAVKLHPSSSCCQSQIVLTAIYIAVVLLPSSGPDNAAAIPAVAYRLLQLLCCVTFSTQASEDCPCGTQVQLYNTYKLSLGELYMHWLLASLNLLNAAH